MTTYNCKHSGDQYSITKFNRHGEVESSYLCDHVSCQCPAGVRDTCRHRLMLPTFLEHDLVNSHLFLDWDNGKRIVDFNGLPATVQSRVDETSHLLAPQAHTDTSPANLTAAEIDERIAALPVPAEALLVDAVDRAHRALGLVAPAAGVTSGSSKPANPNGWRRF